MNTSIGEIFSEVSDKRNFFLNGGAYLRPLGSLVVICLEGISPSYIDVAAERGYAPTLRRFMSEGGGLCLESLVPSVASVNVLSMLSGVKSNVHGVGGDYRYNRESKEVTSIFNSNELRCETIFSTLSSLGMRVGGIFPHSKWLDLLASDIELCNGKRSRFLVAGEKNHSVRDVLSKGWDLYHSLQPHFLFILVPESVSRLLSSSSEEAQGFMHIVDNYMMRFHLEGASVAVTASNGLSEKVGLDTNPLVLFLQDEIDNYLGHEIVKVYSGVDRGESRFKAEETSFSGYYFVVPLVDEEEISCAEIVGCLRQLAGVSSAYIREEASRRYNLPFDKLPPIVVTADRRYAFSGSRAQVNMGLYEGENKLRVRACGGDGDTRVPLVANRRLMFSLDEKISSDRLLEILLDDGRDLLG